MKVSLQSAAPAGAALALAIGLMVGDSKPAAACDANTPLTGEVCVFAFNWCPAGFVRLEGQSMAVNTNPPLYSLIGNLYGSGTGSAFNLPDLRGREAVGQGQGTGLPIGTRRGQESVVLNSAQVPLVTHTHTAAFTGTGDGGGAPLTVTIPVATGDGNASTATNGQAVYPAGLKIVDGDGNVTYSGPYTTVAPAAGAQGKIIANTSGGGGGITGGTVTMAAAEENASEFTPTRSPQLGLTYCMVVDGDYPRRPD